MARTQLTLSVRVVVWFVTALVVAVGTSAELAVAHYTRHPVEVTYQVVPATQNWHPGSHT